MSVVKIILITIFFLVGFVFGGYAATTKTNEEMKALKLIEKYIKENKDE